MSKMIQIRHVPDASVVIEILLRPGRHRPLLDRVLDPGQSPEL